VHSLTTDGRAAHAAIADRAGGIRTVISRSVSEQEFRTTMEVLRRMTENLEDAARPAKSWWRPRRRYASP
jgi:hypothetical protein